MKLGLANSAVHFPIQYRCILTYFFLLVVFTRCLISFNHFSASMIYICTSALFRRFLLACSCYRQMLSLLKLKFSGCSFEMDLCVVVYFAPFSCFITSYNAMSTRAFISWNSVGHFLSPWNRTWPAAPSWDSYQVNAMSFLVVSLPFMSSGRVQIHAEGTKVWS